VIGTCGLCGTPETPLCYSDLIPRAIPRWVRLSMAGDLNPNPVVITEKRAVQTNFRVAEYFLCPHCEDRLNKGGETWVLRNAYRGGEAFQMRSALSKALPLVRLSDALLLDVSTVPDFQLPKLIYFAAGIFWKAAARKWHAVDHDVQLDFGPYAERFRRYLLGRDPFPERAALIVNVFGNPRPLICAFFPYFGGRISGTSQYRMALPGLVFWLHLGHLPGPLKALCAVRNNAVFLVSNLDTVFVRDGGKLISLTKPAASLLESKVVLSTFRSDRRRLVERPPRAGSVRGILRVARHPAEAAKTALGKRPETRLA